MRGDRYSVENVKGMAEAAISIAPVGAINNILLKEVKSPWQEKVLLHSSNNYTDAIFFVWKSDEFLRARVQRLALYVLDALDPGFRYDGDALIKPGMTPKIRQTHNHIWSIYVDSRIAKMGLESFFDRTLRRNLFLDAEKAYPWHLSKRFFGKLWEREGLTHPEILDYACDLGKVMEGAESRTRTEYFEVEINLHLAEGSVEDRLKRIAREDLREMSRELLEFVTTRCPETTVHLSYYGIRFIVEGELLAEMITTKADTLLITLFDFPHGKKWTCYDLGRSPQEMGQIQGRIKQLYDEISRHHSHARHLREPSRIPI
jgi:hypothetical protein